MSDATASGPLAGICEDPERTFASAGLIGHPVEELTGADAAWAQAALHAAAWRLRSLYGMQRGVSSLDLGPQTWWALSVIACGADLVVPETDDSSGRIYAESERALRDELRRRAACETTIPRAPTGLLVPGTDLLVALVRSDAKKTPVVNTVKGVRADGLPLLVLDPVTRNVTRENW